MKSGHCSRRLLRMISIDAEYVKLQLSTQLRLRLEKQE